uniref:Putative carotenoid cleavage dioxygenase 4, chloroplastic n=1 Tax=Anthurium amnicola TaxID=1678845 RepID=A0A1D1Z999_9ARAE
MTAMDALLCSPFLTTTTTTLPFPHHCRQHNPLTPPNHQDYVSAVLTHDRTPIHTTTVDPPATRSPSPPPPSTKRRTQQTPPGPLGTPSLAATLCNTLDGLINNFIDPAAHRPSFDPRHVLANNFAPVGELPPTPCPLVRGRIPQALRGGAYLRNGPNPQHLPRGPHHLFDGDGMLHALLLDGHALATFCSRYVRTYRYLVERDAGAPVLPSVFSGFHGLAGLARGAAAAARVLTGQMNPSQGVGLANTSLAYFGGRLFALGESDLPYAMHLCPSSGDVVTLGRWDFDGRLSMGMTAHPKKDPDTGEVFGFRYGPVPPFLTYFRFDAEGNKQPDVPIFSVASTSFLHDFAITPRYAIFCDIQIVMQPWEMVLGGGSPVGADPGKVPRVGLLPRYALSEADMRWFDVPGFNPVHAINAWEEDDGDTVVLVAPNVLSVEHALERMELVHSCVEMVRVDTKTGAVSRAPLSAGNLDFGVINPAYQGRRSRYAYLGVGEPQPKVAGVVKLDMEKKGKEGGDCVVARRMYGLGSFGGEPFFVAAPDEGGEEDDGYLVTYVHDEGSGKSSFLVMDARSPELEVVAEVSLPRRVPYGFHGLFVSEAELRGQRS